MLVEHRVDDVDERLVASEDPVPSGEQISLEQPLADVLGQHLDRSAVWVEAVVERADLRLPAAPGHVEDVLQSVARELVRCKHEEVVRVAAGHSA